MKCYVIDRSNGYNFVLLVCEVSGSVSFNVSKIGDSMPSGGYVDSGYICKIKGQQDRFLTDSPKIIGRCDVRLRSGEVERRYLRYSYNGRRVRLYVTPVGIAVRSITSL